MNQPPTCETLPSTGWLAGGGGGCCVFFATELSAASPHASPGRAVGTGTGTVRSHQGEFNTAADLLAEVERLGVTLRGRVQRREDLRSASGRSSLPRSCCQAQGE